MSTKSKLPKWVFVDKRTKYYLSSLGISTSMTNSLASRAICIEGTKEYATGYHHALIRLGVMAKGEYKLEELKQS